MKEFGSWSPVILVEKIPISGVSMEALHIPFMKLIAEEAFLNNDARVLDPRTRCVFDLMAELASDRS